jgi:hypothetical protein
MAGLFGKIIRGGIGAVRTVTKIPGAGSLLKAVPVVGTVAALGSAAYDIGKAMGVGGGSGLPALPSMGGSSVPMLPGMGNAPTAMGNRGIFANDPNIIAALQPFAISKGNLKVSYRAPQKGFVIRYDQKGDPFAVPKNIAKAYLGWKPSKKPPISVGDWEAVKRADRTVKKVKKVMTTMTRVDKAVGKGGKVKIRGGKKS